MAQSHQDLVSLNLTASLFEITEVPNFDVTWMTESQTCHKHSYNQSLLVSSEKLFRKCWLRQWP